MSGNRSSVNKHEQVDQAWERLETLLPDYETTTKLGWIEKEFGTVYVNPPRRRVGIIALSTLILRTRCFATERYRQKTRQTSIGELPEDPYYPDSPPPKLRIKDTIYEPINPVDGDTSPTRQTSITFLTSATGDRYGGFSRKGIDFELVDYTGESSWVSVKDGAQQVRDGEHSTNATQSGVGRVTMFTASYYSEGNSTGPDSVNRLLDEHNVPKPYQYMLPERALVLLDFCMNHALELSE